ncbi:MAG: hypothetical protein BWY66_00143 [bacterium ADurb.Bin374]|nr:MAG: hypothetical protein BWY66_00143 [bacterium ADurb.Bin374]
MSPSARSKAASPARAASVPRVAAASGWGTAKASMARLVPPGVRNSDSRQPPGIRVVSGETGMATGPAGVWPSQVNVVSGSSLNSADTRDVSSMVSTRRICGGSAVSSCGSVRSSIATTRISTPSYRRPGPLPETGVAVATSAVGRASPASVRVMRPLVSSKNRSTAASMLSAGTRNTTWPRMGSPGRRAISSRPGVSSGSDTSHEKSVTCASLPPFHERNRCCRRLSIT